jgi:hypothetical protein
MSTKVSEEFRFFGIFREKPSYHFFLFQFIVLSYLIYRLLSRDYTIYGNFPYTSWTYSREYTRGVLPFSLIHYLSFQFIYSFVEPSVAFLRALQYSLLTFAFLGIAGVFPRLMIRLAFLGILHLTGLVQATNAEIDGGELMIISLLVLSISPKQAFYSLFNRYRPGPNHVANHWPLFLFFVSAGCLYCYAGLNKIFDMGILWPFTLRLDRWGATLNEQAIFYYNRFVWPPIADVLQFPGFSLVSGFITLAAEIGFIGILFWPRHRLFLIVSMITMHVLVHISHGINFLGNSVLLLLCLDWNAPFQKFSLSVDPKNSRAQKILKLILRGDLTHRIELKTYSGEAHCIAGTDADGFEFTGIEALEQAFNRSVLFWPFAILLKIPGMIYLAKYFFSRFIPESAPREPDDQLAERQLVSSSTS